MAAVVTINAAPATIAAVATKRNHLGVFGGTPRSSRRSGRSRLWPATRTWVSWAVVLVFTGTRHRH
jgi:hypothetical protein